MKLRELATILNVEVVCRLTKLEREVEAVFALDPHIAKSWFNKKSISNRVHKSLINDNLKEIKAS